MLFALYPGLTESVHIILSFFGMKPDQNKVNTTGPMVYTGIVVKNFVITLD